MIKMNEKQREYLDKLNDECLKSNIYAIEFIKYNFSDENVLYDIICYDTQKFELDNILVNSYALYLLTGDDYGAYAYYPETEELIRIKDNHYTVDYDKEICKFNDF